MEKQIQRSVTAGSNIVLPTNTAGRSTKAQRLRQKATREEVTENHGASKRVKITVETCLESLEQHIGDNCPSQNNIIVSEDYIYVPEVQEGVRTNEADSVLDTNYECIADSGNTYRSFDLSIVA